MRLTRLVTVLMASGLALLALAVALSLMTAAAATGEPRYDTSAYRYTDNPSAAAMAAPTLTVYIDHDFNDSERERIGLALRQWNHVLNGFMRRSLRRARPDGRDAARDRSCAGRRPRSARSSDGPGPRPRQRPLHRSRRLAMVASAQRLPLNQLNWCVGPGLDGGRTSHR